MRYLTTLLLLVTLVGCGASYEPIEFDFRGLKLGDPAKKFEDGKARTYNQVNANGKHGFEDSFMSDSLLVNVYSLEGVTHGFIIQGENISAAYTSKYGPPHYTCLLYTSPSPRDRG